MAIFHCGSYMDCSSSICDSCISWTKWWPWWRNTYLTSWSSHRLATMRVPQSTGKTGLTALMHVAIALIPRPPPDFCNLQYKTFHIGKRHDTYPPLPNSIPLFTSLKLSFNFPLQLPPSLHHWSTVQRVAAELCSWALEHMAPWRCHSDCQKVV